MLANQRGECGVSRISGSLLHCKSKAVKRATGLDGHQHLKCRESVGGRQSFCRIGRMVIAAGILVDRLICLGHAGTRMGLYALLPLMALSSTSLGRYQYMFCP